MATKITLKNVRLGPYPNLWTARQYKGAGDFNYDAAFYVPKNSPAAKELLSAYDKVAREGWGDKAPAMLAQIKGNPNRTFLINGDDLAGQDGTAGHLVIKGKRKKNDGRVDVRSRDGKSQILPEDGIIYAGCTVHAVVEIWAQTKEYPGLRLKLLGVQFIADGDALLGAGSSASDEDFENLDAGEGSPDAPEVGGGYV